MSVICDSSDSIAAREEVFEPYCKILHISEYPAYSKIIDTWIDYAQNRKKEAEKQELMPDYCDFNYSELELKFINESLNKKDANENICVCLDKNNQLQSISSIDSINKCKNEKFITILNLATNPKNIRSILNKDVRSIKGSSSNLIKYVEKISKENKCGVRLNPLGNTVGFYEKNGFSFDEESGFLIKNPQKM